MMSSLLKLIVKSLSIKSAFCDEYACGNDENIAHSSIETIWHTGVCVNVFISEYESYY